MQQQHPLMRPQVARNINMIASRLPEDQGRVLRGSAARNHLAEVRAQLEILRRRQDPRTPTATVVETLRDLDS